VKCTMSGQQRGVKRGCTSPSSSEKGKKNKDQKVQERLIFDNSILEDLKCPVCHETPKDVTTTPCGHNFCTVCIQTSRETSNQNICAVCREHLGTWKPRTNLSLAAVISKQDVQCPHEECNKILKLKDLESHKEKCLFRPLVCSRCQLRYLLSEHEKHTTLCTHTPCNSEARGCTFRGLVNDVKKHMIVCHFEVNRWLIDLLSNEIKAKFDKLSQEMNSKFDAVNERISTVAYQVDELSRVVHTGPDEYGEEEDEEDDDDDMIDRLDRLVDDDDDDGDDNPDGDVDEADDDDDDDDGVQGWQ